MLIEYYIKIKMIIFFIKNNKKKSNKYIVKNIIVFIKIIFLR